MAVSKEVNKSLFILLKSCEDHHHLRALRGGPKTKSAARYLPIPKDQVLL
jgi:hypothetical protein